MAKYKIIRNQKMPTTAKIEGYKDFSDILQQVPAPPPSPGQGFFSGFGSLPVLSSIAAIIIIAVTVLYINSRKSDQQSNTFVTEEMESVADADSIKLQLQPILPEVDVPFENFTINAAKGKEIESQTGSKIIIPPYAFRFQNGEIVSGEVEFRYREFVDAIDFIAAGIPMVFSPQDDISSELYLASAAMCEIRAFQNGEELIPNQENLIEITIPSEHKGNEYEFYVFDDETLQWQAEDQRLGFTEIKPEIKKATVVPDVITPARANPSAINMKIDVDYQQFPELRPFSNISWQYTGNNENMDPRKNQWAFERVWADVKIKRSGNRPTYLLEFSDHEKSFTTEVIPVFEGADFDNALMAFEQNLARSEQISESTGSQQPQSAVREINPAVLSQVNRRNLWTFAATSFGIMNVDKIEYWPRGPIVTPTFQDERGNEISSVFLIDKNLNSAFPATNGRQMRFDPKSKNLLVGVSQSGKIAIMAPEDFTVDLAKGGNQTMILTSTNNILLNHNDFRNEINRYLK